MVCDDNWYIQGNGNSCITVTSTDPTDCITCGPTRAANGECLPCNVESLNEQTSCNTNTVDL